MVDALPVEDAVGPGEVDELEEAESGVDLDGVERVQRPAARPVDDDDLPGLEFPDEVRPDHVEGR